jgi:hypothetical protein
MKKSSECGMREQDESPGYEAKSHSVSFLRKATRLAEKKSGKRSSRSPSSIWRPGRGIRHDLFWAEFPANLFPLPRRILPGMTRWCGRPIGLSNRGRKPNGQPRRHLLRSLP